MNILKYIFIISLIISNISLAEECSRYLNPTFPQWSFSNLPKFEPSQFLPTDFIKEIESSLGPIEVKITASRTKINFSLSTPDFSNFMRWQLTDEPKNNALRIDNLNLRNPLNKKKNLHLVQKGKGLPGEVFRFARNQLFELVRKADRKRILTNGPQNYTVYQLYSKLVGMTPTTEKGKKYLKMLNQHYSTARKHFPEEFRPKSLNDFSTSIGGAFSDYGEDLVYQIWKDYQENKFLSEKIKLLSNKKGEVIAFAYLEANKGYPHVYYLDTSTPKKDILHFHNIRKNRGLELGKEL